MSAPTTASVRGRFDGRPVPTSAGDITPIADGARFGMRVADGRQPAELDVALVIASGRQHQVYLSRTTDGRYQFMPLIWSTATSEWIDVSLYRAGALDPDAPSYWRNHDVVSEGRCFECHLSQFGIDASGENPVASWVDLPINCEACHGPGGRHVDNRKRKVPDDTYGDLHALSKHEDVELCGQCHGAKWNLRHVADGRPEHLFGTLADRGFRVDGTQYSTTYQYLGHVLSPCYLDGAAACSSCHDPHRQNARDLIGRSAEGPDSNRQCDVCHRDKIEPVAARAHSRHDPSVRCVDCHMAMSWITDSPRTTQRTSDHSISIPRPAESIAFATPNACTTCHGDRTPQWAVEAMAAWGVSDAVAVRPWVRAVAMARRGDASSAALLQDVLRSPEAGPMHVASALALLAEQPVDPSLVPALEPYASDPRTAIRTFALLALAHHDTARAFRWLAQGRGDRHPFVRVLAFEAEADHAAMPLEALLRYRTDLLEVSITPPVKQLDRLAAIHRDRGEVDQARDVLDLRIRGATQTSSTSK